MTTVDPVSLLKGYSPPPKAGFVTIYAKDDGSLWQRDGDGAEVPVGAGDGSGIPQGGPLSEPLDADGNPITNLAEGQDPADAATVSQFLTLGLGVVLAIDNDANNTAITNFSTLDPASPPEVPATPDAQDIVDALIALGLVTQAAP